MVAGADNFQGAESLAVVGSKVQIERGPLRTWLTREGFAYVVVTLFVAAAALLRNINLLILMNGLMVAPLLLSWRICASSMRKLAIQRVTRPLWFAGRAENIHWEVSNEKRLLPVWQIRIDDRLERIGDGQGDVRPEPAGQAPQCSWKQTIELVGPLETRSSSQRVWIPERGLYRAGPARVQTSFPFGLVRTAFEAREQTGIIVAPAPGRLVTGWDRRLLSEAVGDEALKRRASWQGDEFFAVRPWRDGDSLRLIHWRSTARQGRPMVRQMDRRSDRDVVLVLDLWLPDQRGGEEELAGAKRRVELALSFACSVLVLAEREARGRILLAVCGRQPSVAAAVPDGRQDGMLELYRSLASAEATTSCDVAAALREIMQRTPGGTPVYVVSTRPVPGAVLFSLDESMEKSLAQLQPWIRFLSPDTPEFDSLFTPPAVLVPQPGDGAAAESGSGSPSAVREEVQP